MYLLLLLLRDILVLVQQHWCLDLERPEKNTNKELSKKLKEKTIGSANFSHLLTARSVEHPLSVQARIWSSPGVCCPWRGAGRTTIFRPSKEALHWYSSCRKELLSWAKGKSNRSLWPAISNSTECRILSTAQSIKASLFFGVMST